MICKLCKNNNSLKYSKITNIYDKSLYKIFFCENCFIGSSHYDQNKISNLIYETDYNYEVHNQIKKEKIWRIKKNFKKLKALIDINSNTRILDIGCMYGYFLDYLNKEYACKVDGLELENINLDFVKNKNLNIYSESLTSFSSNNINKEKYDLIILSHTFEHFHDPILAINCIKSLLKENGLCYIIVPNFNSTFSKLSKRNWGWLQPAVHPYHYTYEGFKKLFENFDFKITFSSYQGGDSLFLILTLINIFNNIFKKTMISNKNSSIRLYFINYISKLFKYMYYISNDEISLLIKKNDRIKYN